MRFIFHNPHHAHWFKKPSNYGIKRKGAFKYEYLFDYFLKREKKVYIYVDKYKPTSTWYHLRNFVPPIVGLYAWIIRNKINPFHVKIIFNISKANKTDILFSFLYGNFTNLVGELSEARLKSNELISKCNAFKVVHLTHYMHCAAVGSLNSKKAKIDLFVAENNLFRNSAYFKKHFDWYQKDVYTLPFVLNGKFKRINPFDSRKDKALAMGTITSPIIDKEFIDYFGHRMLHPMRTKIYENRNNLLDEIDSFISPINNLKPNGEAINDGQKQYFALDIVTLFNEYQMFIVPEEVSDLPGIGFIEGMACGAAFIGIMNPMYEDFGMKDKLNFIGYDGTLDDLCAKIKFYKNHQGLLKEIADNGYELARKYFNKETVTKNFLNHIESRIH